MGVNKSGDDWKRGRNGREMKYEVKRREVIFRHPFLRIEKVGLEIDRFRGEGQLAIDRYSLVRPDVVGVVVYVRERASLVLVEQFRYATVSTGSGWMVEIVAGVIEDGATPEETARREVLEEVGYRVENLRKVAEFYTAPGFSDQYTYLYVAEVNVFDKVERGGGLAVEGEDIRVHELEVAEVRAWLRAGKIRDAMTLAALQHFLLVEHGEH
ncbi:hypothetical protein COTS27_01243 [Spirochaetota bacterium]|nr:hypothetical protein COTS27_01243 [Spirochaetota bacterium]